ncbi:MAG: aldolase/citrate lyase family protein [Planctomycetota bacterium]|jgi:methylmalonyl-CoA mutase cobalamin-binding subunit
MNVLEKEMILLLKDMKENHQLFEIKAEFEAEASRMVELARLKDVASSVGLPLILKIGGVEAITDIYNCLTIGVAGIVAPMAETAYAVSKFLNAITHFIPEDNRKAIEFAINIETITAYNNIDDILNVEGINLLSSITVGRVDFSSSMGLDRRNVNGEKMFEMCKDIFKKSRAQGLKTALGGAISPESRAFIKQLTDENLINKFETRKAVFKSAAVNENYEEGIMKAIKFELLWLKSKKRYYSQANIEDDARINMLEKRLDGGR